MKATNVTSIAHKNLDAYLEGWRLGDPALSLAVLSNGFFYDDPNTGRIFRDGFVEFMEAFKADAAELNNGIIGTPFLTYTDIIVDEVVSTAWCWWQATETELQGAARIYFNETGIQSERIAYFSKLP